MTIKTFDRQEYEEHAHYCPYISRCNAGDVNSFVCKWRVDKQNACDLYTNFKKKELETITDQSLN